MFRSVLCSLLTTSKRKPVWVALSDLYLDTELQDHDFRYIAKVILDSSYDLAEAKEIDKYEVFPLLHGNLLDVAGAWAGFNETWLVEELNKNAGKRTPWKDRLNAAAYAALSWMTRDEWTKVEEWYELLKKETGE